MQCRTVILAFTAALLVGCSGNSAAIQRGTPITHVQLDYGLPDVISDESGDEKRYYVPTKRPEYEWPPEALRTFYYLDRDLAVTFVSGKAVSSASIKVEEREEVLLPLVRRHSGGRFLLSQPQAREMEVGIFAVRPTGKRSMTYAVGLFSRALSEAIIVELPHNDPFLSDGLGLRQPLDFAALSAEPIYRSPQFHVCVEQYVPRFGTEPRWRLVSWERR
jgi:hypothetical protein